MQHVQSARAAFWPSLVLISVAIVVMALGVVIGGASEPPRANPLVVVATQTLPGPTPMTWQRRLAGQVEAGQDVQMAFEVSGPVAELAVDRGDRVETGAVLARLHVPVIAAEQASAAADLAAAQALLKELETGPRSEVLEAAKAGVAAARAESELAAADAQRFADAGAGISEQVTANARQRALAAAARLRQAEARFNELSNGTRPEQLARQRAAVAAAESRQALTQARLDQAVLRAPVTGVVIERRVDPGTLVQPGQVVLVVQNAGPREVHLALPADLADHAPPLGASVEVVSAAGTVEGTVLGIVPARDALTRSMGLRLRVDAPLLQPGEWVHALLEQTGAEPSWSIPRTALREGERGQWSCLVAEPVAGGHRVAVRLVQVLRAEPERALVTGGLAAGDLLISGGQQHVLPGMAVQPQAAE
jgi:multidrug efflux pump subunit AcrA (membrane-fusion protein)